MIYNDWIRSFTHSAGFDGFTDIEVKDMQGNWLAVARFYEMDDLKTTKQQEFVRELLYRGQPFRHATN